MSATSMPAAPRLALALLLAFVPACGDAATLPPELPAGSANTPVDALDLDRYLGRWHEVARLPMFFQRNCASDTTATYRTREDGRLEVRNACRTADGPMIESLGLARTTGTAGALEVTFVPGWLGWMPGVWADYWVVDLDADYEWAVVGGPKQGALWVLSRTPTMAPELLARLKQRAEARGYVLSDWIVAPAPASATPTTD